MHIDQYLQKQAEQEELARKAKIHWENLKKFTDEIEKQAEEDFAEHQRKEAKKVRIWASCILVSFVFSYLVLEKFL